MKPAVTHQYGNALVTIHFADLSEGERQRRMERGIRPSLAQFGRAALAAGIEPEARDGAGESAPKELEKIKK